jgi:hypothetical protein
LTAAQESGDMESGTLESLLCPMQKAAGCGLDRKSAGDA